MGREKTTADDFDENIIAPFALRLVTSWNLNL